MSVHRKLTIGLFGFGVVGEGLYKILQKTPSLNATTTIANLNFLTDLRILSLLKNT